MNRATNTENQYEIANNSKVSRLNFNAWSANKPCTYEIANNNKVNRLNFIAWSANKPCTTIHKEQRKHQK